jgi:hypothetical protein
MTTAVALVAFAARTLLGVLAGALSEIPFARRKADAGRSGMPMPSERVRLRR